MDRQPVLQDYLQAFAERNEPFLNYYAFGDDGPAVETLTRGAFLDMSRRAAGMLAESGCAAGDRVLLCLSRNHYGDLACRLGAAMIGCVPVTVNWQADTRERVLYKLNRTTPAMILADAGFDQETLQAIRRQAPQRPLRALDALFSATPRPASRDWNETDPNRPRIIIFTSGTTGEPKGVELSYRSYRTNRATFEALLGLHDGDCLNAVVVNPLHHTNSTAITDWALRRPGSRLHLFERYSTPYWRILAQIAEGAGGRVVAPTVSRHVDFLAELDASGRLPLPLEALKAALPRVDFLIGSAPVGPTTIRRLQEYTGRVPTVRFGSTETCLQVLGIPWEMDETERLASFEAGWTHRVAGEALPGYYIGRPTPPFTEVRVVTAITPGHPGFMEDRDEGVPGYLVTRGGNLMTGYVGDAQATADVFADGWYTGLRDIVFRRRNPADGAWDYYWVSRDSSLLIRGGANYACPQIEAELKAFLCSRYDLGPESFDLAVIGLRLQSEHEDDCCVTIEWRDDRARASENRIRESFCAAAAAAVSKGARPDHVRFGPIPRNFKGAVQVGDLRAAVERSLRT